MSWMTKWCGLLAAVAVMLVAGSALPCADCERHTWIVGLARDGAFLRASKTLASGSDALVDGLALHARDGTMIARDLQYPPDWQAAVRVYPALGGIEPPRYESFEQNIARLKKGLGLTPLSPVPIYVAASNRDHDNGISSYLEFEAYARGSRSVIARQDCMFRACHHSHARLYRHRHSPLWFLTYRDGLRPAQLDNLGIEWVCYTYIEDVLWLPRERLRSAAMGARALGHARAGRAERATSLFQQALELDPTDDFVTEQLQPAR